MSKTMSLYLDLTRLFAATVVFLDHLSYRRFTGGFLKSWNLHDYGNDAVMVFFVLSGFVIAYVSDKKETTLKAYSFSRLARLWSVVIPALILTITLDAIGSHIYVAVYNGPWVPTDHFGVRLVANLFFVNQIWFLSIRPFSDGPFWSIGYEFWYYVIFAAAFYVRHPRRYLVLALICLFVGPKILLLLPVWLLGVWAYSRTVRGAVAEHIGWILFTGSIAAYIFFREMGLPQLFLDWTFSHLGKSFVLDKLTWSQFFLSSYVAGILVALNFVGFSAISHRFSLFFKLLKRPIRYFAGFTFAIYLFHVPLLQFFTAVSNNVRDESVHNTIVIVGTVLFIWLFGMITERRKSELRVWLTSTYEAAIKLVRPRLSSQ